MNRDPVNGEATTNATLISTVDIDDLRTHARALTAAINRPLDIVDAEYTLHAIAITTRTMADIISILMQALGRVAEHAQVDDRTRGQLSDIAGSVFLGGAGTSNIRRTIAAGADRMAHIIIDGQPAWRRRRR